MIYSVGFDLQLSNTGVEKAQFKRHQLLTRHGIKSKLVYTRFNPHMAMFASEHKIQSDYISMYDYLQGNMYAEERTFDWVDYWLNVMHYEIQRIQNTNDMRIYQNNLFIMYASFYDEDCRKLRYVNYFDKNRTKIMREVHDARGFLSVKYLLRDNLPYYEQYLSADGITRLEKFNTINEGKQKLEKIIVRNQFNQLFHFNNESQLRAYFFDEIYEKGDIFIIDRPLENSYPITLTRNNIPAYVFFHTTHFKDLTDINDQIIKPTFRTTFKFLHYFKGIITSTEEQKQDIERIVHNKVPVYAVPVGYVTKEEADERELRLKEGEMVSTQRPMKIVSFGRYEIVKQLHHQIEIVAQLVKEFSELEFHLFGFGSRKKELEQLIIDFNMQNNIFLHDYTLDVAQEYRDAALSMSTSYMEGFSLSILESLCNGVPVFAYDVKYGPRDLIAHRENGELVPYGDKEAMYKAVKSYLSDERKMKAYKENCRITIRKYTEENNMDKWKKIINTV